MTEIVDVEPPEEDRPHYRPDLYPWIRAWGQRCRYDQDTVASQIARALTEHAPKEAIYRWGKEDAWSTLGDVVDPETRLWLVDWAESRELSIPPAVLRLWLDPYVPIIY